MPLFKSNIQSVNPPKSHFREADIIFTAKDIDDAERRSEEFAELIPGATVNSTYRIGG
jgi:hypothetical protein